MAQIDRIHVYTALPYSSSAGVEPVVSLSKTNQTIWCGKGLIILKRREEKVPMYTRSEVVDTETNELSK